MSHSLRDEKDFASDITSGLRFDIRLISEVLHLFLNNSPVGITQISFKRSDIKSCKDSIRFRGQEILQEIVVDQSVIRFAVFFIA